LQKLIILIIPAFLAACVSSRPQAERIRAEQSAIPGVPVPAGSLEQGRYDGGGGVVMAFYSHPRLKGDEVLAFYERRMPERGWAPVELEEPPPRQRSFERDGVPVLIGVEAEAAPARFSIIRGARGDWGFMPQLRKLQ
jgi:hypothetical protein